MAITRKKLSGCPIEATISAISARWKARIVWQLAEAPKTFVSLRAGVEGISDRMLTEQLAQLTADLIIEPDPQSARLYRLSELGQLLLPVLDAMRRWGEMRLESGEVDRTTSGRQQSSFGRRAD